MSQLNQDFAVEIYCGLKNLAATLVSRFVFSTYCSYASGSKSFQICVSLRFFKPRHDPYNKNWIKLKGKSNHE
jgi:hypothetical protein